MTKIKKEVEITSQGVTKIHYMDGDQYHVQSYQDVDPIIEKCKEDRNKTTQEAHYGSGYKVGEMPMTFAIHAYKYGVDLLTGQGQYNSNEACKYVLSHPQMRKFKSYPGKISKAILPIWVKRALDRAIEDYSRI